jgi:phosphatidylglycerol lysyltransferase
VLEFSHFLGSLAGVALLLLAVGLQRRLDAAYHLTVAMLATGIAVSLLKGLDYEEALLLGLMLVALLPCRSHFYRRAALTAERLSPEWIAAIGIVLAGVIWLGFFSYKHVEYDHSLWWEFTLRGNAPRFLRATVGVVALTLGVAVARLLRTAPHRPAPPTPGELDRAMAVAARSESTYAYLALLGDKQLLFPEPPSDDPAFLMYAVSGKSWVALGDPVGPEEAREELAWRFLERVDRYGGCPVFYQVGEEGLHLYVDLGLSLVKLGEEARVPLADFSLQGSARKKLRYAIRRVEELGGRFEVVPAAGVAALLPELRRISDAWLAHRSTREKSFSLGSFDAGYLERLPVALVRMPDGIAAFANLWLGASGTELSIDLMRHTEAAPPGVMDYLLIQTMLWGRTEGYRWFNLGMAPLSGLAGRAVGPLWNRLGTLLFRHGEPLYHFQGLRQYKDKFDPVWEARYLACPGGLALPRVLTEIAALISGGLRGVFTK